MIGLKPLILDRANSWLLVTWTTFLMVLLAGCGGPSQSDMVGKYSRSGAGVTETVEIKGDGTFNQTVQTPSGQVWKLSDSWVLKPRGVTFNQFYEAYDVEKQSTVIPPIKVAFRNCFWKQGFLVCSDTGSYVFQKTGD